jgi:hypothetical protein
MKQPELMTIAMGDVVLDRGCYPRVSDNWQTVARYVDSMRRGDTFPPIHVVPHDGKYVLLDGWNRTQAMQKLNTEDTSAVVWKGMAGKPIADWLAHAASLNRANARPMTAQDKTMVADRLKRAGFDVVAIAKVISVQSSTVERWLVSRIVEDGDGKTVAIKGAMRGLVGTKKESNAVEYAGPVANANCRRTIDEMLAMLKSGVIDIDMPSVRDNVAEIHKLCGKLLSEHK